MSEEILSNPVIQWGFAGLSVVLLGLLVWLVKTFVETVRDTNDKIVSITKETTTEIGANTAAIAQGFEKVHDIHSRQLKALESMSYELNKRPCILPKDG